MDSDDYWIDDDALRKFEIKIKEENPDVVVFKNCIYDELTGTFKEPKKDRESEIALEDAIKLEYFDFSAWNKAVKRSLLVDNNIAFKKGISEDMLWSYKILLYSKKISFCLEKRRTVSLTAQKCVTYREEYFKILDDIGNLMRSNENIKAADLYASMVYITLCRYLRNSLDLNEQDVDFVQCLSKNKSMLRCCANWKIAIIRFMIYTLGVKNTIAMFRKVKR